MSCPWHSFGSGGGHVQGKIEYDICHRRGHSVTWPRLTDAFNLFNLIGIANYAQIYNVNLILGN